MALLTAGHITFDADLVAFDKDGTLIDFEFMWGTIARAWADTLAVGLDEGSVRAEIHRSWGYDAVAQRTLPGSPLAIASTQQLQAIAAGALYRCGLSWPEAEDRARAAMHGSLPADVGSISELVRPTGDVVGLMSALQAAGVRIAVVTTDSRTETVEAACVLGIAGLVDWMVCGDDGLPVKPAPDMLLAACRALGVEPARTAVVGDTEGDLFMAARAGAGLRVAVLTGAGDPAQLALRADVVLPSIDGIQVAPSLTTRAPHPQE